MDDDYMSGLNSLTRIVQGRRSFIGLSALNIVTALFCAPAAARGDEPAVTTLADFEGNSVAASVADVVNVQAADCRATISAIPARGQRSLQIEIGATQPRASAAFDLRFRMVTPFHQADRVAMYAWITQGVVDLQFRVRDARGRSFETERRSLTAPNRWIRMEADLSSRSLQHIGPSADGQRVTPTWPIMIQGCLFHTRGIGRQVVFIDDLEVEHRVVSAAILSGEFQLDEPTHIYSPGARVHAALLLENKSRRKGLPLSIDVVWLRSDGAELTRSGVSINLPAGGDDYRSRQPVDFSQDISEPGLYRLVGRVSGPRWTDPAIFQTTIAVTYSNRALPRGRSTFYGVQSNLMNEPSADQRLEIDIAREIGVQLLALETPWKILEPRQGQYEFKTLDFLINRITRKDIAVMLVLTEPPDWADLRLESLWRQQTTICEALTLRFGDRIALIQPLSHKDGVLQDAETAELNALARRVAGIRPGVEICAPPIRVPLDAPASVALPNMPEEARFELAFETAGPADAAREALEAFAQAHELIWGSKHRWIHRADSLIGSGGSHDAVAMLDHYLSGLREGVGGVVWRDLRDGAGNRRLPEQMRGLVQRDFSPKNPLLGFANFTGVLHGLLYAGAAPGAPPDFDSAILIGGARQVVVMQAKPNRVLPLVLSPYQIVGGDLSVIDFDRRYQPMAMSDAAPLAPTRRLPFFIEFEAERSSGKPMIGLAKPWLRAPRTVYCDREAVLKIELDAPMDLRSSYLQISPPPNSPIKSSLSSRALRADIGQTLSLEANLTRLREFHDPVTLTLRIRIEGQTMTFPVIVRPLAAIRRLKNASDLTNGDYTIGRLSTRQKRAGANAGDNGRDDARILALRAGYQDRKLYLAVELPPNVDSGATIHIGAAAEGAETHAEARVEDLVDKPRLRAVKGLSSKTPPGWRCQIVDEPGGRKFCRVSISPRSLGLSRFESATRVLASASYEASPRYAGVAPIVLEWGDELADERTATLYNWTILSDSEQ